MAGIPRQVDDKNLETKVLLIFQRIGCTINPTFIDDCHRLGKNNDRVIVKFTRRKDCKQSLKSRKTWETWTRTILIYLGAQEYM